MTNRTELERTIRELREMELMQKELEAEIETLKDTLKAALNEAHTEEMIVGTSIVQLFDNNRIRCANGLTGRR